MTRASSQTDLLRPRGGDSPGPVARGIRVVLWLLIVVAGCYVAYGYSRLWNEWRETPKPIDDSSASNFDPATLTSGLPLEGPWSFAQLDWDIRSQRVTTAEVAERLEKLGSSTPVASDDQLPDVSPELVELAESLGARSTERADHRVFEIGRPNLKAQLVVRPVAGKAKVLALAVALPQTADHWQFFELIPRGSTAANAIAATPQLLPLPAGARRDGGRFTDNGRAILELVSLDSTADELIALWKAAGWEVRPGGLGGAGEFSFLCARGREVVYAWSADRGHALKNLMLVRTPNGPDTNAAARVTASPQSSQE